MQTIGSVSGALIYTWWAHETICCIYVLPGRRSFVADSALLASVFGPLPYISAFLVSGLNAK